MSDQPANRAFLMLQGPHGPFFRQLAAHLSRAGAEVWRVGFNRGDQAFWRRANYLAFTDPPDRWPDACAALFDRLAITDLVLYGDSRPIHAQAIALAKARGLTVHVFEEGYLRPHWVTYERGGANGNSRVMSLSIDDMRRALAQPGGDAPHPPGHWGDMREHVFYGGLYHFFVMAMNGRYPNFRPHRAIGVSAEFRLHLRRLLLMPAHSVERALASRRIRRGGFPFHTVLLQLEHDASFQSHSDLPSMAAFIGRCLDAFAQGAPRHHHLVFKAHPLEDGRVRLSRLIRDGAAARGLIGRVHFVRGGKLARLLDTTQSAVTVNSTAGQQALWRGLPLRALGRAVYGKPGLVSDQPLTTFFAAPQRPDQAAYLDFRQFLMATSQLAGGYYSARGRAQLLRQVVDRMLADSDMYDLLRSGAATRQHLVAVA